MKRYLFACLFVLSAVPAFAQVHPCDAAVVQGVTTKSGFDGRFCWDGKDVDGNAVVVTAVDVLVDGSVAKTTALPAPTGAASATGFVLYVIQNVAAARGGHTVSYRLDGLDGTSTASATQAITVIVGNPKPPTNAGVVVK